MRAFKVKARLEGSELHARRELVEREVKDQASPNEQELLRTDEDLAAWRSKLTAPGRSLEDQLPSRNKRLADRQRLYESFPENPEVRQAYLQEKDDYAEWKPAVGKLKETLEARLSENKALRQKQQERQMLSSTVQDVLARTRELIANEEAVLYRLWPEPDELPGQIDRAPWGGPDSFKGAGTEDAQHR